MASVCRPSALDARPAAATSSASRRTTALLSEPRLASRTTRSGVIRSGMGGLFRRSAGVPAGGRDGGGGAGGAGGARNGSDGPLGRGGDGGSGERRAGRSVRDGGAQSLGRRCTGQVGEEVAREAAVTRADGAAHRDLRWAGGPHRTARRGVVGA